jgi:hypothetical protein
MNDSCDQDCNQGRGCEKCRPGHSDKFLLDDFVGNAFHFLIFTCALIPYFVSMSFWLTRYYMRDGMAFWPALRKGIRVAARGF